MKRYVLSPVNRLILSTIDDQRRRFALMRSFRTVMNTGEMKGVRAGAGDIVRLVYMAGIVRQPVFYLFGTLAAIFSYFYLIYLVVRWVLE